MRCRLLKRPVSLALRGVVGTGPQAVCGQDRRMQPSFRRGFPRFCGMWLVIFAGKVAIVRRKGYATSLCVMLVIASER